MTERFSWRFYICVLSNIYKEKHIIFTGKMIILELILVSDKFVVQLSLQKIFLSFVLICSVTQSCSTLWPHGLKHARLPCSSPYPEDCSKLMCTESVVPSSHLVLCLPLLLPSVLLSIRVFSNESALCIRWPKYWSFSFSISPSSDYSGLISFWMDWFDLLAVQGTLKSLLHHSAKASILRRSAFFIESLTSE